MIMNLDDQPNPKERKSVRQLVIRPIEGLATKSSTGLVDPRLFTGENTLQCIMDPVNCMWYFKMQQGGLPEALKTKFTNFSRAYKAAESYYATRNLQIVEVRD